MAEFIVAPVPLVAGFVTAQICKMDGSAGSSVSFRPPAIVFQIAWPILYVLMGLAWAFALRHARSTTTRVLVWTTHVLLTAALCAWLAVYSCARSKVGGVYVIVGSILAAMLALIAGPTTLPRLLLAPLLAWLLFALQMNIAEVTTHHAIPSQE